ncbi:MAG TPA: hypothetical protein VGZ31_09285 [Chthoniobacterales bacterium]|jgi:hypothetical protein|nr:hypothetical protein [Chthoniobacterales bacterium]
MKRILLPFVSALIASNIFAAPISYDDAKKARCGVPIYDVVTLSRDLDRHMGELIAVQCNFRGKDIHHLKPNWYEGSIWKPDPEKRGKFASVRIMIAKKDLDAFKSIPTAASGDAIILYGRVEHDVEAHFSFLRLVSHNALP